MDSGNLVKIGAAAAAGYAGFKYLDAKHSIKNDLRVIGRLLDLKKDARRHFENGYNVRQMWYDVVGKNPKKDAILYLDRRLTFADVERMRNQVSHWLLSKGIKRGDTVALLMENRPEFVISWLGMTKIGVKVAMINTSIKHQSLVHCIKISECKMLFFGAELSAHVRDIISDLNEMSVLICGSGDEDSCDDFCPNVDKEIAVAPDAAPDAKYTQGIGFGDTFGYIYTSGTTGLPKAAVILHSKMYTFGAGVAKCFLVTEKDICYTTLPLFHSAGGGLGVGMMFATGCTMVIKRKFSASEFWKDCVKYKCTVVQYIGELCRYLLNQPKTPEETKHCVRIAIGNGLRPEIWGEFQERFHIPEIGEFYGATESNGALFNHCVSAEDRGACGRMGTLLKRVSGTKLVKFDVVEEEPIRYKDGLCRECDLGEAGELLFPIIASDPSTRFAGYNDKKATEKKIIRDVMEKGDCYFRSGDLLKRTAGGYYHFVDRIGDTFRWRGENCSTNEIAQVLSTFPGVEEINVYGSQIENLQDGRAPSAVLIAKKDTFDFDGFAKYAVENLPSYSVPLFLRLQESIATTATMKHQKVQLKKEGIDINVIPDPMMWFNKATKRYEEFTQEIYNDIISLRAKL